MVESEYLINDEERLVRLLPIPKPVSLTYLPGIGAFLEYYERRLPRGAVLDSGLSFLKSDGARNIYYEDTVIKLMPRDKEFDKTAKLSEIMAKYAKSLICDIVQLSKKENELYITRMATAKKSKKFYLFNYIILTKDNKIYPTYTGRNFPVVDIEEALRSFDVRKGTDEERLLFIDTLLYILVGTLYSVYKYRTENGHAENEFSRQVVFINTFLSGKRRLEGFDRLVGNIDIGDSFNYSWIRYRLRY